MPCSETFYIGLAEKDYIALAWTSEGDPQVSLGKQALDYVDYATKPSPVRWWEDWMRDLGEEETVGGKLFWATVGFIFGRHSHCRVERHAEASRLDRGWQLRRWIRTVNLKRTRLVETVFTRGTGLSLTSLLQDRALKGRKVLSAVAPGQVVREEALAWWCGSDHSQRRLVEGVQ